MRRSPIALAVLAVTFGLFAASHSVASEQQTGDVLLIERVQAAAPLNLPARGLSMAQVESRYGAPTSKLEPRGGQKPQWPVIHRWSYPEFVVYFERDRVINAVVQRATPDEIGPRPVN